MNINRESEITKYVNRILSVLPSQQGNAGSYIICPEAMYEIKNCLKAIIEIERSRISAHIISTKLLRRVSKSLSEELNYLKEISQIIDPDSMDDVKEIGDRQLSSEASDVYPSQIMGAILLPCLLGD